MHIQKTRPYLPGILLTALFSKIKRRLAGEKAIKIFRKETEHIFKYSPNQEKIGINLQLIRRFTLQFYKHD